MVVYREPGETLEDAGRRLLLPLEDIGGDPGVLREAAPEVGVHASALRDRGGMAEPIRTGAMKQLGQRLAILEKALGERPPCLHGLSVQELARLVEADRDDPYRLDALLSAMTDEQVELMYAAMSEEPRR